jgi:hypothetical protein
VSAPAQSRHVLGPARDACMDEARAPRPAPVRRLLRQGREVRRPDVRRLLLEAGERDQALVSRLGRTAAGPRPERDVLAASEAVHRDREQSRGRVAIQGVTTAAADGDDAEAHDGSPWDAEEAHATNS